MCLRLKQSKNETEKHHQRPYCEFHHHIIGSIHIHIDSKHPEHDKKQFFCDHCSRSFIFKISLKKHHENLRTIARLREKNLREKGIIHWLKEIVGDVLLNMYLSMYTEAMDPVKKALNC